MTSMGTMRPAPWRSRKPARHSPSRRRLPGIAHRTGKQRARDFQRRKWHRAQQAEADVFRTRGADAFPERKRLSQWAPLETVEMDEPRLCRRRLATRSLSPELSERLARCRPDARCSSEAALFSLSETGRDDRFVTVSVSVAAVRATRANGPLLIGRSRLCSRCVSASGNSNSRPFEGYGCGHGLFSIHLKPMVAREAPKWGPSVVVLGPRELRREAWDQRLGVRTLDAPAGRGAEHV